MIIIFLILILIGLYIGVIFYAKQLVHPNVKNHEYIYNRELERGSFEEDFFEKYPNEAIYLTSDFGYELFGKFLNNNGSKKIIMFCHGITLSHLGSLKYVKLFWAKGYSVLIYDHRNHGKSGSTNTSFGYYEKFDAKKWVDYLYDRFDSPEIGVHGESMGASIALQLVTIDNRIKFCIEDCSYSNAKRLFIYRTTQKYHKLFSFLTSLTKYYIILKYKWSFDDVSVEQFINMATCPILFIHGTEDLYIPTEMCVELFDAYNGEKMLYLAEGARHAMSFATNSKIYTQKIYEFLDKYIN